MSRFRLFLAWLVLAALPLQGFAAATMLFCGMEQTTSAAQVGGSDGNHGHTHAAVALKAGHDHAAHGHATAGDSKAKTVTGDDSGSQDKTSHSCPICASCCHVVAVGGFEAIPQVSAPPSFEPTHPTPRVVTRTASVPDKPPRA